MANSGGTVSIASYQEVAGTGGTKVSGFVLQRSSVTAQVGTLSLSLLADALKDEAGNSSTLSLSDESGGLIEKLIPSPYLTKTSREGWSRWATDPWDPGSFCQDPAESECHFSGDVVSFTTRSFGCDERHLEILEPTELFDWSCTVVSQDPAAPLVQLQGKLKAGKKLIDLLSLEAVPAFKNLVVQVRHYPGAFGDRISTNAPAPWWNNCVQTVDLSTAPGSAPNYAVPFDFPSSGACLGSGTDESAPIYVLTRPLAQART